VSTQGVWVVGATAGGVLDRGPCLPLAIKLGL
jgi:hypothetical protein